MTNCPECGGNIIADRHELVCEQCGLVIGEDRDGTKGTSGPLGSTIDGVGPQDWKNVTTLTPRHKKLHDKITDEAGGLEKEVEEKIDIACAHLNLADYIVKDTKSIYVKFRGAKNGARGYEIPTLIASCIYAAARQAEKPIDLVEIGCAVGEIEKPKKTILRTYKVIMKTVGITPKLQSASDYVPAIVNKLELPIEAQKRALEIISSVNDNGGINPRILAGSAVYLATMNTGYRRLQREIASVTGVTEISIRIRAKELAQKCNLDYSTTKESCNE